MTARILGEGDPSLHLGDSYPLCGSRSLVCYWAWAYVVVGTGIAVWKVLKLGEAFLKRRGISAFDFLTHATAISLAIFVRAGPVLWRRLKFSTKILVAVIAYTVQEFIRPIDDDDSPPLTPAQYKQVMEQFRKIDYLNGLSGMTGVRPSRVVNRRVPLTYAQAKEAIQRAVRATQMESLLQSKAGGMRVPRIHPNVHTSDSSHGFLTHRMNFGRLEDVQQGPPTGNGPNSEQLGRAVSDAVDDGFSFYASNLFRFLCEHFDYSYQEMTRKLLEARTKNQKLLKEQSEMLKSFQTPLGSSAVQTSYRHGGQVKKSTTTGDEVCTKYAEAMRKYKEGFDQTLTELKEAVKSTEDAFEMAIHLGRDMLEKERHLTDLRRDLECLAKGMEQDVARFKESIMETATLEEEDYKVEMEQVVQKRMRGMIRRLVRT